MGPGVEAFLVYAVAALCSCAVSFVLGRHWPARRVLDEAWEDGADACAVWSSDAYIFRCDLRRRHDGPHQDHDDKGTVEWNDDYMATRPAAEMRGLREADLGPGVVESHGSGERQHALPPAVHAGGIDVPRPTGELQDARKSGGPGHLPSQDTYRAELARIGRPDPAPWYAALVEPDPPVEPGPPAEPAWLERLLYKGAMSTAWCETFNSREMEVFHAHVDEWDRFIAAWAQEARWVTVGCRAWPPPGLVPA